MPILLVDYGVVRCHEISQINQRDPEKWGWRKEFEGKLGRLQLYESKRIRPGETFIHFSGGDWDEQMQDYLDWYLRASYGQLSIQDGFIVFCTKNSKYVFQREGT